MTTDLTPQEIARWLRDRAHEYEEAAKLVERTSNGQSMTGDIHRPPVSPTPGKHVTVEQLRDAFGEKKHMRLKTLADITGVRKGIIRRLLTEENGFELLKQGWIGLRENQ
jgi:hypothetical protein